MKKTFAVIGQGFVGGAVTEGMSHSHTVLAFDKAGKYSESATRFIKAFREDDAPNVVRHPLNLAELVNEAEKRVDFSGIYFVCLPTPMFEDGEADLSIVEGVLQELASCPPAKCQKCNGTGASCENWPCNACSGSKIDSKQSMRIAVVKSTVPPGSTERWNKRYENFNLRVVFNPEFLTEANAINDFKNQTRIVLGGPRPWINRVKQLYQEAYPLVPIIKTSSTTAEMVKYFTNVQLATRVVLSCELAQLCEALDRDGMNIDYDKVVEYAKYDTRLGGSHMNVPGNDGISGARGHCFPKDLNALIVVAKRHGVLPTVMEAVWKKNIEVVPPEHRDWEKMIGRAISKRSSNE